MRSDHSSPFQWWQWWQSSIPYCLKNKELWCTSLLYGSWLSSDPFLHCFSKKTQLNFRRVKQCAGFHFKVTSLTLYSSVECIYIAAPLTVIVICYAKVFHTVSRSNRVFMQENNPQQLRANVEDAKVTKTLAAVMVGFTCCWLPICIVDNIDATRGEDTLPRQAYLTYGFLCYLSSTINPFIYVATNKQFRREYKAILSNINCFGHQNSDWLFGAYRWLQNLLCICFDCFHAKWENEETRFFGITSVLRVLWKLLSLLYSLWLRSLICWVETFLLIAWMYPCIEIIYYINKILFGHIGSEGNSEICFQRISIFPSTASRSWVKLI